MTHDLINNVLTGLDALVHKVVVTELKDDTFYAVIWLEKEGTLSVLTRDHRTLWRWRCEWIVRSSLTTKS